MNFSKLVAIITGAISIILAIAYLIIAQLLDFRGEMLPAPQSQLPSSPVAVAHSLPKNGNVPINLVESHLDQTLESDRYDI